MAFAVGGVLIALRLWSRMALKSGLKSSFLSGLILLAPVVVTVFIINTIGRWVLGVLGPVVRGTRAERLTGDFLLAQLLVAVIAVLIVVVVGFVAQYSIGRRLFGRAGRVMGFIPVVRTIYSSVRQVASSVSNRASDYDSVVLVEYPREGVYSIGLVTAESPAVANELAGGQAYNVFFPSSPNPTGGKLVMIPEEQVHPTDLSVRRGIQILMTTGMAENEPVVGVEDLDESLPEGSDTLGIAERRQGAARTDHAEESGRSDDEGGGDADAGDKS